MSLEIPERKCRVCGEVKSAAQFSKDASTRDGLSRRCKACAAAQFARWREEHKNDPEYRRKKREQRARYREKRKNDPEFRRKNREHVARWREERKNDPDYREKERERHARYHAKNAAKNATQDPYADPALKHCPECGRDLPRVAFQRSAARLDGLQAYCRDCVSRRHSDWERKNPEKRRALRRRRRARKRENGVIPYDEADVWTAYHHACIACGAPGEHVDHFQPIAKGGADAFVNVVILCEACNLSKGARDPIEFLASRGIRFNRVIHCP